MEDYEIGERLGRGGFGVAYKARRLADQRDVVIKFVEVANEREGNMALSEAFRLASLSHPNIVSGLGAVLHIARDQGGKGEDRMYISPVMDLCPGGDLAGYIERKRAERKTAKAALAPGANVANLAPPCAASAASGGNTGSGFAEAAKEFGFDTGRRGVPEPVVWRFLEEICAALTHAHGRQVMHRDLHPRNIVGELVPDVSIKA